MVIADEARLAEVARYLHLNPVRVASMGLGKADRERAQKVGVDEPTAELVSRRLECLRDYPWSSWRVYTGAEPGVVWLETGTIGLACGGSNAMEIRSALRLYTEAPLFQGGMPSPWSDLVGGLVLGTEGEAAHLVRAAKIEREEQLAARRIETVGRPGWGDIVGAAEAEFGRAWIEIVGSRGGQERDVVLVAATRHLGWSLAEVVREIPGLRYNAAAHAVRRFARATAAGGTKAALVGAMVRRLSNVQIRPEWRLLNGCLMPPLCGACPVSSGFGGAFHGICAAAR